MPNRQRGLAAAAVLLCLAATALPGAAEPWQEPAHWAAVGTVADWADLDAQFYRLDTDVAFLDRSQQGTDQRSAYERTEVYSGRLDAVTLDDWLKLPADEQARRSNLAADEVEFIVRFRLRLVEQLQRSRSGVVSGWGAAVSDVTVVGDCLQRLRTALGLDPANPYNWHMYAWLAEAVGDLDRLGRAINGAERALALVPADKLRPIRAGVALQAAWLAWDRGRIREIAGHLERARSYDADPFAVTLLGGLAAAVQGDEAGAIAAADALRSTQVRQFPLDYRTSGPAPDVLNVSVWKRVPSDYAASWIRALVWLQAGDADLALKAFRGYSGDDIYPLGWRFWNAAGVIYEVTGRRPMSERAWNRARISRPMAPFFPTRHEEVKTGRLTGRTGRLPLYLSFDRFYNAGSRLARSALQVQELEKIEDEAARQDLAADIIDELDASQARGEYAAQAALLRGSVYHALGDKDAVAIEVREAVRLLNEQAQAPGAQNVLRQLGGQEATPAALDSYFGQSGSSQGRWAAPDDPEADIAERRAALEAQATDENRRALARSLIRSGREAEGRAMVAGSDAAPDLVLALEADRSLGDPALAVELAGRLTAGDDPWADAGLWTMVGFVCLDHGRADLARPAIERALELDPGNQGLRNQVRLMKGGM
jgi:tetratricopeptide (TPR) repeat protein